MDPPGRPIFEALDGRRARGTLQVLDGMQNDRQSRYVMFRLPMGLALIDIDAGRGAA